MDSGTGQLPPAFEKVIDGAAPHRDAETGINFRRPLLWLGIIASAAIFWLVVGSLLLRFLVFAG